MFIGVHSWSKTNTPVQVSDPGSHLRAGFLIVVTLPAWIDFGREFAAANQLLQVPYDRAPGHLELARQRGDVRALVPGCEPLADLGLTAEAVGGSAQQFLHVHALGALERFKLPDHFGLAAFGERGFDG